MFCPFLLFLNQCLIDRKKSTDFRDFGKRTYSVNFLEFWENKNNEVKDLTTFNRALSGNDVGDWLERDMFWRKLIQKSWWIIDEGFVEEPCKGWWLQISMSVYDQDTKGNGQEALTGRREGEEMQGDGR